MILEFAVMVENIDNLCFVVGGWSYFDDLGIVDWSELPTIQIKSEDFWDEIFG